MCHQLESKQREPCYHEQVQVQQKPRVAALARGTSCGIVVPNDERPVIGCFAGILATVSGMFRLQYVVRVLVR